MNAQPYFRVALMTATVFAVTAIDTPLAAQSKLNPVNWFKKTPDSVPSASEQQSQEAAAQAMLRDAKTAQSTGDAGKALSIYRDIVSRYRFTNSAANAQFEYASILRSQDKLKDAFEAFQKFITDYRQSSLFDNAIEQQFQIAEEARAGKKQPTLLLIPMKMDRSELVTMYQGVIRNSPYGKYASYSQFAIGEVYQDDGDKVNANIAFQTVVENYPRTKLASEAQFRIGAISSAAAQRTQDSANLNTTRDALETYRLANPDGERMSEAEALLSQSNEALALKSLEVAKFYEKAGKPAAAAIYYNEALTSGSPEIAVAARERLAAITSAYPEEMKNTPAMQDQNFTVPAATQIKNRDEYAGPPAPVIAQMSRKSEMRIEEDNFQPIPLVEPDLPVRPADQTQPGMLLPPAEGTNPLLLPVPPAPDAAAPDMKAPTPELPVPAAPAPAPASEAAPTPAPAAEEKPAPAPAATPEPVTEPKP
ncbi:outer membrane protein assembly factor BamD [Phragmitibacter flavus]|uniref:Outer membrane protein assembly factor BamD n=1 Tax=Phragmitibacter flavus TaxID=2576071 RepID=A0A5R8KFF7_9BACT|nr:outer membrane protein assembly factor BamD [Phragmitibacter flavus]TLD70715.1 outer membrane protein assembly factor BamD [Phragmitibacter flavus]